MFKKFIYIFFFFISFVCYSCSKTSNFTVNPDTSFVDTTYIFVDLRGEVIHPRVYKVKKGILLDDLIKLAGGFTKNANLINFNLVSKLEDNCQIIIPSILNTSEIIQDNYVNINLASLDELMMLPKIGSTKAAAIIEYRTKKGRFNKIEDIMNVNGIGESLYEEIKAFICI